MSIAHVQVDLGGNNIQAQPPGTRILSQEVVTPDATAGNSTISISGLLGGIIQRTGPAAPYTDTFPTADLLMQAQPDLGRGDSFKLVYRNTVAQAMTAAAGEGGVLGTDTAIAASSVREYLCTVLASGPRQVIQASLTNGSPNITGIVLVEAARLNPGQGISGTNIPANAFILSVNQAAGTAVMSANATGTAVVAATTFPRYSVQGVRSSPL